MKYDYDTAIAKLEEMIDAHVDYLETECGDDYDHLMREGSGIDRDEFFAFCGENGIDLDGVDIANLIRDLERDPDIVTGSIFGPYRTDEPFFSVEAYSIGEHELQVGSGELGSALESCGMDSGPDDVARFRADILSGRELCARAHGDDSLLVYEATDAVYFGGALLSKVRDYVENYKV